MSKSKNTTVLQSLLILCGFLYFMGPYAIAQDDINFADEEFEEIESESSDDNFSDEDFEDLDETEFDDSEDEFADEDFEDLDEAEFDDSEFAEEELGEEFDEQTGEESLVEDDVLDLEEPDVVEEAIDENEGTEQLLAPNLDNQPVQLSDEPDLDLEAQLHNIYIRFHKQKTDEVSWNSLVGSRLTEKYVIQQNDKLWGISETLFGDGNYWPKVWSLNSNIKNPHLINPNNSISFVLGDESGPPAFTITEKNQKGTVVEVNSEEGEDEPEIPPPLINSRPVVKNLPPSLPSWQTLGEKGEFDDFGIDYGVRKISKVENKIYLSYYISEKEPAAMGQISEVEAGSKIASTYQYVFVELEAGVASEGDKLLVISDRGLVKSNLEQLKGYLGRSVEVQGEIQLVEQLPIKKLKKTGKKVSGPKELFRAIVTNTLNPVSVGSLVVKESLQKVLLSEDGPRSDVEAQIIGGENFTKRVIYGTESIAYINKGSEDGLEEGQVLSIRENREIRNPDTLINANLRPIGWAKVARVEPNFSTIIIVRSWSDILTGDLTGTAGKSPAFYEPNLDPQSSEINSAELDETDGFDDDEIEFDESEEFGQEFDLIDEEEAGFDDFDESELE